MSFDWQTEEDGDWEDDIWQEKPETAVSAPPPWRTIILLFVLATVAGTLIYQQINKRIEATTAAIEADIFATHNLLNRATATQDGDLGKTVLSGRDRGWSRAQTDLIEAGLFFEHPGLSLMLENEETAYDALSREDAQFIDLVLAPGLDGGELTFTQDFLAFTGTQTETITLQRTAVYRQGETRWLLSPPLETFWGEWQTLVLENVTYIYPRRDEEILLQITNDLNNILKTTCEELPELNCSAEMAIQLRFDTNADSLLETADFASLYNNKLRLNLPTPTLVGLPVDDAGYEALKLAYGRSLVSALIGENVAYDCCRHAPLFQAILTYQLSELGLANWPVTQETQAALAEEGVHTEMIFPYWNSSDLTPLWEENSWQLYGFVDFLIHQFASDKSALTVLGSLTRPRTYQSWLVSLANDELDEFATYDSISRDWWFYALTQSEVTAVSQQPVSFPTQDLQLSCLNYDTANGTSHTTLYRYQLDTDTWITEFEYSGLAFFIPLPQDNGIVLQLVEYSEEQYWRTVLWRNGRSLEVMNLEGDYSISLGQMDPNGRFLLSYFGDQSEEQLPEPSLIDMESCQNDSCSKAYIGQTPHWSPDGQQMLLTDLHLFDSRQYLVDGRIISLNPDSSNQPSAIWLSGSPGSAENAVQVDVGISPFWISNELFGYIRPAPAPSQPTNLEVVVASTASLQPETLVDTAAVQAAIPENNRRNPLLLRYAIAHPANPNFILLMASTQANDSYIFQIDRQSKTVEMLFLLDLSRGDHSLGFSPDGRFLVASGSWRQGANFDSNNIPFGILHIYDLETNDHQTVLVNTDSFFPSFTFDWSNDGNWLAFTRDTNVIGLTAPSYDYQQTILHENGICTGLAWINPLPTD